MSEATDLREQQIAIHKRLQEIRAEESKATVALMAQRPYFRFTDIEHSTHQNRDVYLMVVSITPKPTGEYAIRAVSVWPEMSQVRLGDTGWTLVPFEGALKEGDKNYESITHTRFMEVFSEVVLALKRAAKSTEGDE